MVKNIKIKSSKLSLRSATDLPAHSTGEQTQATTAIASATMYPKNLLLDAMIARGAEGKALNEMLDPNQLTSEPLR